MEKMKLFPRFVGSVFDKLFILFLFVIIGLAISPYGFPANMGQFMGGIFGSAPSAFLYIDSMEAPRSFLEPSPVSYEQIDSWVIHVFTIINVLYYFIFEWLAGASAGKLTLGGRLMSEPSKVSWVDCLFRALALGFLMYIFAQLRYALDVSYTIVIPLFFLVVDLPVFFCGRSLIDIITGTYYVRWSMTEGTLAYDSGTEAKAGQDKKSQPE